MKRTTQTTLAALLLVGIAAPAFAAPSAQEFVTKASISDMFEIQSSKLALSKSSDGGIKSFASHMVADHSKSTAKLKATIAKHNLDVQPATALDDKHKDLLTKLQGESGKEFDNDYVSAQKDGHDEAVDLFTDYSKDGDNASLKKFATAVLPTIKDHQKMIHDMAEKR